MRIAPFLPLFMSTIVLVSGARAAEESFPGIENLMSKQEYVNAGLEKLTPAEREALNDWLVRYTANEADFIRATDPEVKEASQNNVVTARLVNDFSGWSGKTYFYLDNGQIWKQRLNGTYHYTGESPEVTFKKNLLGFWTMTVVSSGMGIGVKRVK